MQCLLCITHFVRRNICSKIIENKNRLKYMYTAVFLQESGQFFSLPSAISERKYQIAYNRWHSSIRETKENWRMFFNALKARLHRQAKCFLSAPITGISTERIHFHGLNILLRDFRILLYQFWVFEGDKETEMASGFCLSGMCSSKRRRRK